MKLLCLSFSVIISALITYFDCKTMFIKFNYFICKDFKVYVCFCVCVRVCAHECKCLWRPPEGHGSPGTTGSGHCQPGLVLGSELWFSVGEERTLNHWVISLVPVVFFIKFIFYKTWVQKSAKWTTVPFSCSLLSVIETVSWSKHRNGKGVWKMKINLILIWLCRLREVIKSLSI